MVQRLTADTFEAAVAKAGALLVARAGIVRVDGDDVADALVREALLCLAPEAAPDHCHEVELPLCSRSLDLFLSQLCNGMLGYTLTRMSPSPCQCTNTP